MVLRYGMWRLDWQRNPASVRSMNSRQLLLFALLFTQAACAADFDLLITNAQIADGSGAPLVQGSIAVKNGKIGAVGKIEGTADSVIDAGGKVAAPGFINVHTHSEDICLVPAAENFLRMGVTTIITGNCGHSRTDVVKFFEEIAESKVAINVATLIGHGSVREQGMGGSFIRAPNAEQLAVMKGLVDQAMQDGAVGLSTGLIYVPDPLHAARSDDLSIHAGARPAQRQSRLEQFRTLPEFAHALRQSVYQSPSDRRHCK